MDAPCGPWPIDTSCWNLPEGDDDALTETIEKWQMVATTILWRLTGRRWGTCMVTVRPCLQNGPCGSGSGAYVVGMGDGGLYPYTHGGEWYNAVRGCGCGSSRCSCSSLCKVVLPGPVHSVRAVVIDGEILEPEAYGLLDGNVLIRRDGECWPECQDMAAPNDALGAFAIAYERGVQPEESAIQAVSAYTYEFVKSCVPDCGTCNLPKRVTQVTRQGVAAQFIDPQTYLENGLTGLEYVDQWIMSVNPYRQYGPASVISPDALPTRVFTR